MVMLLRHGRIGLPGHLPPQVDSGMTKDIRGTFGARSHRTPALDHVTPEATRLAHGEYSDQALRFLRPDLYRD
jgi:hypothetical protein